MIKNYKLVKLKPYVISITFSFLLFLLLAEISTYFIYKERISVSIHIQNEY